MALDEYRRKRNFRKTAETPPRPGRVHRRPIFVVQEHHASHLHYDFRLEADGVLKSWAVPKGPSLDPSQKRLAVQVEDHPLGYATFEGTIPEGQYGAGTVKVWDHGTYELDDGKDFDRAEKEGRIEFMLHGKKLKGRFLLLRMKGRQRSGKEQWLLIKVRDRYAHEEAGSGKTDPEKKPRATKRVNSSQTAPLRHPDALEFTHLDKVLYPDDGITKGDVLRYYERIADRLLPYLRDRPATLERFPQGVGGGKGHFWQKDTPAYYPDWIPRAELPAAGRVVRYAVMNDLPTLLYLVNQNTLTFHVWLSRLADLDRPDMVLFDLDRSRAEFAAVVAVAQGLRRVLERRGVQGYVKISGKSGLHVLTPWTGQGGFDAARAWAHEVAGEVTAALTGVATTEIRKAKRGEHVYLDVLQNAKGKHVVPPYVLRGVPGAPVSTPLAWDEVTPELDPTRFNLKMIFRRLARVRDPWAGFLGNGRT
jgi:bifunctional non-homologous end joining protein LigD